MLTDEQRIRQLLESSDWSPEDRDWLLAYLGKDADEELRSQLAALYQRDLQDGASIDEDISARMRLHIGDRTGVHMRPPVKMRPSLRASWWAAAAAILAVAALLYLFSARREPDVVVTGVLKDVPSGGNRATLTLADGRVIRLDSAGKGAILAKGNTAIVQLDTGLLRYSSGVSGNDLAFNTISTPRGGQYQVVLSDGTHVWLNAASSLRFPTAFAGGRRTVELTGEAYFEVSRKPEPFAVSVVPARSGADTMRVAVLGTHFNVNAYTNEAVQTVTLLEGSVRVEKGTALHVLRPGQQAIAEGSGRSFRVDTDADMDEAVAWKNGQFIFNNVPLETVMRQVERWYDVDVRYEGEVKPIVFNGQLSRYANVSRLLDLLQTTGEVHFTIENKKIVVRP